MFRALLCRPSVDDGVAAICSRDDKQDQKDKLSKISFQCDADGSADGAGEVDVCERG